ncbi:MAG TPA: hypothetical protein DF613_16935 [Lachnospiraceae bacterium]|nr:hypothetical protein [Lachnospiraceae bacterium]
MTEKAVMKMRKREKRFHFFLKASMVFHVLALWTFFLAVKTGGAEVVLCVGAVFFGIGSVLSGIAGINANYFWGVAEGVITSKEKREELLKMCEELE